MIDELSRELGYADRATELPGARSKLGGEHGLQAGILSPEDELLVEKMRRGLANLVAALDAGLDEARPRGAVGPALDGAEMVIRGELLSGNAAKLPELMPGFVFLVVLPVVGNDEALELSRRTGRLVEGALG